MNLSNSWKRICFKIQQNSPQLGLTFVNRTGRGEGEWESRACFQTSPPDSDPPKSPLKRGTKTYFSPLEDPPPCPPAPNPQRGPHAPPLKRGEPDVAYAFCYPGAGGDLQGKKTDPRKAEGFGELLLKLPRFFLTLSPPVPLLIAVSLLVVTGSLTALTQPLAAEPLAQSLPVLTPTQPAAVEELNKGIAYIQQGKLQDAIAAFQKASQLNPQLAPAHYNLGLALRQAGQLQSSADAFYKATQADPDFALAFANLGAALLEGNNVQQARDYLTRALELDPNLGVAHYNYGLLLSQVGEPDQAIAQFKSAMQLSQNAPEPAYHIGLIYLQKGKIEEAKKLFQQALKINPQYAEAHYNLGSILFNQGKLDAALEAFRKSAQSNSNYANAYYGAGLVFLRQNRFSDAQQVLQYAKALYTAQGNSQWAANADQLLQRALNSNP